MDKEKFKAFLGLKQKTPEQKKMEAVIIKMQSDAAAVNLMRDTRGWKLLDEFFKTEKDVINQQLKLMDPFREPEKIIRLQEKSKLVDELYSFLNARVLRGE